MSGNNDQTALAVIPATALPMILAADENDILGKLSKKVAAFKADASTPSGRDEVRSLAYEIAKSKTALIKIGKGLTEGWRESTKAVNAECKQIEDRMDGLRDKVRAPLTAWENREKDRVAAHEAALAAIVESSMWGARETADEIRLRIEYLEAYPSRDWQEFTDRAADTLAAELSRARRVLADVEKREADAAELIRLRAEAEERAALQAEQDRIARESRIAEEAAANARKVAEAEAERARAAAQKQADEAAARALAEREALANQARRDQERIARMEADAKEAEAKAVRDREAAIEAERKRVADALAATQAEERRRAANVAHRKAVNRDALRDIMTVLGRFYGEPDEACGIAIVTAIAKGEIDHVRIEY